jgi:lipopolysaccharide biosynthesis glycosyltransferase
MHAMPTDEQIVIVSGADDAFAMPMAVALYSALTNLRRTTTPLVYLLDDGISRANKDRIARVLHSAHPATELAWLTPDLTAIQGLNPSPWNTRATYMRLFIPDLLGDRHRKAIYFDSDVVVTGDLAELWAEDLGDRLALAVTNFTDPTVATGLPDAYQAVGLDPSTPYFNAGVLVINVERWRRERIAARVFEFLERHSAIAPFADQDGLNAVLAGDWGELHPRWNVQLMTLRTYGKNGAQPEEARRVQEQMLANPGILHYIGPRKPWNLRYRGRGASTFVRYLRRSGWYGPARSAAWAAARSVGHVGTRQLALVKDRLRYGPGRGHPYYSDAPQTL